MRLCRERGIPPTAKSFCIISNPEMTDAVKKTTDAAKKKEWQKFYAKIRVQKGHEGWEIAVELRNQNIIEKMTLKEKASMLSGKGMWRTHAFPEYGIPEFFLSDGPHGMRTQEGEGDWLGINKSKPATCFPTAATIANSWDRELAKKIAEALGEEAAAFGVDMILGPGLNIKRSPLCGRNFEYFSEDPYLAGEMAAAYVTGIQSRGVAACPKHFAVNSQELRRMSNNSVVDERTLREIYTAAFETTIKKAKPKAIMSSYNQVNGVYANENAYLLQTLLRKTFGFDGIVVSDWGASNDHTEGARCGSNLEMPGNSGTTAKELVRAVREGRIEEKILDQRIDEILTAMLPVHQTVVESRKEFSIEEHHKLARRAAAESIVLLKNEHHILPLNQPEKIAVIGEFAEKARYQGAGSSLVNATKVENVMDIIGQSFSGKVVYEPGYRRNQKTDTVLLEKAKDAARAADAVLLFVGLDEASESEGMDRTHMRMPQNQLELIEAVADVNTETVVVLSAGSAMEMPWIDRVKAVVHGYLGGQAGASAMLAVLTGKLNPSGKLNETYPLCYEDTPAYAYYPGKERNSEYREGLYVGYRYYDTVKKEVLFPFGYGLSYTEFTYSNLHVTDEGARFEITNTGTYAGAETAQLYVEKENAKIFGPVHELKGFCKVFLKPGETKTVTIPFEERTFAYFNIQTENWEEEEGIYRICIAKNSRETVLTERIHRDGSGASNPYEACMLEDYRTGQIRHIPDSEYRELLGHEIPDGSWKGELERNDAFCQLYYAKGVTGRLIYQILDKKLKDSEKKGEANLDVLFFYNMPFRGLVSTTHGIFTSGMVDGFVKIVNGHALSGLGKLICSAIVRK